MPVKDVARRWISWAKIFEIAARYLYLTSHDGVLKKKKDIACDWR
jgi:hypothetical protein